MISNEIDIYPTNRKWLESLPIDQQAKETVKVIEAIQKEGPDYENAQVWQMYKDWLQAEHIWKL